MADHQRLSGCGTRDVWASAGIFFLSFGILRIVFDTVVTGWFPNNDDLPVIVNSALLLPGKSWTDWFTRGFRDYFYLMADWVPQEDTLFYRPVSNFYYFLLWKLLGDDWPHWADANLACHALGVATAFIVARSGFGLSQARATAAAGLMLVSATALSRDQLVMAAFSHEFLLAPLGAIVFFLVRGGRIIGAACTLLIVLLVKETGLWMVAAAMVSAFYGADKNSFRLLRWRDPVILAMPALLWMVFRAVVSRLPGPAGNLNIDYLGSLEHPLFVLMILAEHFLTWPSAYYIPSPANLLRPSPSHEIALKLVAIVLNLAWWALLLDLGWRTIRRPLASRLGLGVIWALTGAAFLVVAPTGEHRYGYSEMVFFIPAILSCRPWRVMAASGLGYSATILWLLQVQGMGSWDYDRHQPTGPKIARDLAFAISSSAPDVAEIYYVGDEISSSFMPTLLHIQKTLIPLANYDEFCAERFTFSSDHRRIGGIVDIALRASDCAIIWPGINGPDVRYNSLTLRRSDRISYTITTTRSEADLFAGPAQSWLQRHLLLVRSQWPATDNEMRNSLTIRVTLKGKARFIIENPVDHSLLVWDEDAGEDH
jgi:hypothetical protein